MLKTVVPLLSLNLSLHITFQLMPQSSLASSHRPACHDIFSKHASNHALESSQTTSQTAPIKFNSHYTAHGKNAARVEAMIELVPALGHLTTLRNLVSIIKDGSIKSRAQLRKEGKKGRAAIGGASDTVYLQGLYGAGSSIRQGMGELFGAHIILSSSVLRRADAYFSDTWEGYGGFMYLPPEPGKYRYNTSYPTAEWEASVAKNIKELIMNNPVSMKDYAVAILIPRLYQVPFEAIAAVNGLNWRNLDIPVIFTDQMLPEAELRKLSASKPSPKLRIEHLETPEAVTNSVSYNFPDVKQALIWLQNPENRKTQLGKNLLTKLNEGRWGAIIIQDFELVLLQLRAFIASGTIDPYWLQKAQEHPLAPNHQEELTHILNEASTVPKVHLEWKRYEGIKYIPPSPQTQP